jgi:hypothetical protein
VEHAASAPSLLLGEKIEGSSFPIPPFYLDASITLELVSRDMDTEVRKVPLGVTAAYV